MISSLSVFARSTTSCSSGTILDEGRFLPKSQLWRQWHLTTQNSVLVIRLWPSARQSFFFYLVDSWSYSIRLWTTRTQEDSYPRQLVPKTTSTQAWRWPDDKPVSELMIISLLTHKYVTRPQWVQNYVILIWIIECIKLKCNHACHNISTRIKILYHQRNIENDISLVKRCFNMRPRTVSQIDYSE